MSITRVHKLFLLLLLILLTNTNCDVSSDDQNLTNNSESNQTDDVCSESVCERTVASDERASNSTSTSVEGDGAREVEGDFSRSDSSQNHKTFTEDVSWTEAPNHPKCQVNALCSELEAECLLCDFNTSCVYGKSLNVTCRAIYKCEGPREFEREMTCRYCYQTPPEEHTCTQIGYCNSASNPVQKYRSNCTAKSHILCLGSRRFFKNLRCNWTSGYRWSTTLILSITLGGFGADRFYLGHWQEGIGKLFSFGGAGVWTLLDVILVAVGYLKPADGSVYI